MSKSTEHNYILSNARIYTMDPKTPSVSSLLVQQGRIEALGTNTADSSEFDHLSAERIDLQGRTILPGLCDAHIHIEKFALMLDQVDCETPTLSGCIARVAARCREAKPGAWVLGHGWNQNVWGGYGVLRDLDDISRDNPVYLTAKSLHAGWANTRALKLCGITEALKDPPRGKLQRDEQGRLTGVLFEDAMRLISTKIPKPKTADLASKIAHAQVKLNEWGITAIHDFDRLSCLSALKLLENEGRLQLRVLKHVQEKDLQVAIETGLRSGASTAWIRIGHQKLFADGAAGPRTAAMLQGYEGEPDNLGMLQLDVNELVEIGKKSMLAGYPLSIHAIGDRANRTVLDAFEILQDPKRTHDLPFAHRIEHAQLLHPDDIERPSRLGITVSMQPIHAISDQPMVDRYWGPRTRWSYAWNSLNKSGALLIFGSDAPVESPNPWLGLSAAIGRVPMGSNPGAAPWIPEERISPIDALRAYTVQPARSAAWETSIGQLTVGSCADLIVLDQDPTKVSFGALELFKPSGVMIDGEWIFRAF